MNAVVFENVLVRFGGRVALDRASLNIRKGEITGIVGPNGAGKTTLLRAALGLVPAGGSIRILNEPLGRWPRRMLARVCAYLPQGGEARWPMTAFDVVMLGRLPHLKPFAAPAPADAAAALTALARCDAESFAGRRMDELSSGERARVLAARALATGAGILLADEPAAFLDPAHQLKLLRLLREEAARGVAVAVTLHDLSLAARHCDRLIVLEGGRIAAAGEPAAALSDEVLAKVFSVVAMPGDVRMSAGFKLI
jgi:iron complex transport system ATP-binding protein